MKLEYPILEYPVLYGFNIQAIYGIRGFTNRIGKYSPTVNMIADCFSFTHANSPHSITPIQQSAHEDESRNFLTSLLYSV